MGACIQHGGKGVLRAVDCVYCVPPPATGIDGAWDTPAPRLLSDTVAAEHTGGSVDYYRVHITNPTGDGVTSPVPYEAQCNDIIEALDMHYAEGNAFKAIWRNCAARTLGKLKKGDDALYNAEKVVFFGQRMVSKLKQGK